METRPRKIKFSAVILTKNDENNIVDCIDSVAWCDEIIVVDDKSEDRTIEIIRNLRNEKIKVFVHPLDNDFSTQRNYGLEKAKGEWGLLVDSDERVSDALRYEIEYMMASHNLLQQNLRGFTVRRIDVIWGKELKYGETGNMKFLRLARKDAGKWMGKVHEEWKINGRVEQLKNPLYHYPHQTITEFLKEINFYTNIRAQELFQKKTRVYWWSIILYPKTKFFVNYFLKRGFLDGIEGFIFAILMSFHSFLVRGKLWLIWQRK